MAFNDLIAHFYIILMLVAKIKTNEKKKFFNYKNNFFHRSSNIHSFYPLVCVSNDKTFLLLIHYYYNSIHCVATKNEFELFPMNFYIQLWFFFLFLLICNALVQVVFC